MRRKLRRLPSPASLSHPTLLHLQVINLPGINFFFCFMYDCIITLLLSVKQQSYSVGILQSGTTRILAPV